jgi:hypothetical protein
MKLPHRLIALACCGVFAAAHAAESAWISMFNGKDLAGWKSNEETPGVFYVTEGVLKVNGGRAHLFYVGPDGNANFKNFEFKAKVLTTPGSNSGIYFHTKYEDKGWPSLGFECQVNTTHADRKKTGGLYGVLDVNDNAPSKDFEWCDYGIKVEGRHVVVSINGKVTADWTQPENWDPKVSLKNMDGRKLGDGTIAIQGHDPKSTTFYKDLFIRALP